MSAFRPISPHDAMRILDAAQVGVEQPHLLANLALAGLVKGYARLIQTDAAGVARTEVRDSRISRDLWGRIVAEGKVADVHQAGSVHLTADTGERVSVIGIRFDEGSVVTAARDHGIAPPRGASPVVPSARRTARREGRGDPVQQTLALDPEVDVEVASSTPTPDAGNDHRPHETASPIKKERARLEPGTVALSIADTAEVLGVSTGTVYNLINAAKLITKKVGRRTLVQADSVRALLA